MSITTSSTNHGQRINILLVEDNLGDARLVREVLTEMPTSRFKLTHVDRLTKALEKLAEGGIDVVLLDLSLPDESGIGMCKKIAEIAPQVPIVVLTGLDDEELALEAVHRGAQDYLNKGHIDERLLTRAIRYAIERQSLQMELEKNRQHRVYAQKLESLGVLAGGIAHDFNNLLAIILGNAELAMSTVEEESEAGKFLGEIRTASDRAAELCKQMLAYSGKGRFVLEPLNLNQVVEGMAHLLQTTVRKDVVIRYYFANRLPAVEGDATQIRQAVLNLVLNAAEAIGDKSGVITISTGVMQADREYLTESYLSPELPEGDYAYVEVTDTGCGIEAKNLTRIFDPFFSTKFTGRGLGLAAVLGICRGHEGAIKVKSQLGEGSTFRFLLKCLPELAVTSLPEKSVVSNDQWRGAGTLLLVDDEESLRIMASRMIELFGFKVIMAQDGVEGVKMYREHQQEISMVLLDMTMPQMNGEETFHEIRRINPEARVLLMSGYNEEELSSRFSLKGFSAFIQKPFNLVEFREKVRAVAEAP